MTSSVDERTDGLDEHEEFHPDVQVYDRTSADRWAGVEVRGYVTPELEILSRAKGGDGRTIYGILVPYNVRQRITPDLVEQFRMGAAAHQVSQPRRMKFAREHLKFGGTLIGRAAELDEQSVGLIGHLRAAKTPAGDEAVELAREGALDELSVGFRAVRSRRLPDGTVERVRADFLETALVLSGAYGQGARVLGVRSADGAGDQADGQDGIVDEPEDGMSVVHARALLLRHRPRIEIPRGLIS